LLLLLYPESYVERVVGLPEHFIKFFGVASRQIGLSLLQRARDIDGESIIAKHLLAYKGKNDLMTFNGGQPMLLRQG
jgi:hypothetical protein